ncbi:hypothetical protein Zmor_006064 [Zophobas morio]|uniref:Integrase p58-like C-terminal domain-containing protein n=1 Tax=Zophobas morio TaxID=2755281 RepID=A0AA38IWU9_9CUCU|nr:hypothetical protein Zmor_006064 [Zophobas morio]
MQEPDTTTAAEIREKALAARALGVQNITARQKCDKARYDVRHRHIEYQPGDKVKIFTPVRKIGKSEKLLLKYFGPYYVVKKVNEVDYEIRKGPTKTSKTDIVHVSRILPYNDPWTPPTIPTS